METCKSRLCGVMILLALVAAAPALAQSHFVVRQYPVGQFPVALAVADFDGDNDPDMVVADGWSGNILVQLGDGAGAFGNPVAYHAGNYPAALAVGDFDGDGDLDVAVANPYALAVPGLAVLLNDGSAAFSAPTEYFSIPGLQYWLDPHAVAAEDLNRDGHLDLIVADRANDAIVVMLGDGAGHFEPSPNALFMGTNPYAIAVGDLNGDSLVDVALTEGDTGKIVILFGDGAGGFASATYYELGDKPAALTLADLDHDGDLDLIVGNLSPNNLAVWMGDGHGDFTGPTLFALPGEPYSATTIDLNGDGNLDLFVTFYDRVASLYGDGMGGFSQPESETSFGGGGAIAADLDGDDDTDLAIVNPFNNMITLLLRRQLPSIAVAGGVCGVSSRSGTINLTLADPDSPIASLSVSASSSNQRLVPNANLVFAGTGAQRTLTVTGIGRDAGSAVITVLVNDAVSIGSLTITFKTGGNGNDLLLGTAGTDMLFGENGDDTLDGRGGTDLLCGGRGNNTLIGGAQ